MYRMVPLLFSLIISVSQTVGFAPLKLTISVRHPYEVGDRQLAIGVFCGEELITLSERPLHVRNAPEYTLKVTLGEACDYDIRAVVYGTKTTAASKKVSIQ